MEVATDELVKRLDGSAFCKNCQPTYNLDSQPPAKPGVCDICSGEVVARDDDKSAAVKNRMTVYHELNAPVLDYYKSSGDVVEIIATGTPDSVFEKLTQAIGSAE